MILLILFMGQEKKIVKIAEEIESRYFGPEKVRLVLITGPSSSGKTTVCKRLSVQLKACGLRPISISTDDYFVNRVETPKLPDGSYDFTVDGKSCSATVNGGVTNVNSWSDVRDNGWTALADSDELATQKPKLVTVESAPGSGTYIRALDFGAYFIGYALFSEIQTVGVHIPIIEPALTMTVTRKCSASSPMRRTNTVRLS